MTTGHTIKVAAELSGIAVETLRVWERRYGFPSPARGDTGHRRYSQSDIERLRLIQRALAAGFRPKDVIGLSRQRVEALLPQPVPTPVGGAPLDHLRLLLEARQFEALERELRALAAALPPKAFVTDIAQPLAIHCGDLWMDGRLAVHEEHFASECISTELRRILSQMPRAHAPPLILLGNLPGELHRLPLELVAVFCAASSATPRILGPQMPAEELAAAAKAMRADAVGVSVTAGPHAPGMQESLASLAKLLPKKTALLVGGAWAKRYAPRGAHIVSTWPELEAELAALR